MVPMSFRTIAVCLTLLVVLPTIASAGRPPSCSNCPIGKGTPCTNAEMREHGLVHRAPCGFKAPSASSPCGKICNKSNYTCDACGAIFRQNTAHEDRLVSVKQ
ncbi:hypothetical protein PGT21_012870 [Puccinia graminis f. sp. tritici]|uniref:C2H2-type domain-containing protein n=1 Tax=Puccinia graminis f. sp. tritici TaxID=56615 RepID=A0A5B0M396_PUCGR|nr:hypothetical protein PGTUg99_022916 [Puccinia graminis f. sp. tritici]KAA1071607.1 hypothetical protein PGT21_012870 [Puccinia graminis f. sp. tritici]